MVRSWAIRPGLRIPPGFVVVGEARETAVLRRGWEESAWCAMRSTGQPFSTGRGDTVLVPLGRGERGVLRRYRRGGLVRHFARELYWGWLPRPVRELIQAEEIRRRGVPTVEVIGAYVARQWGPLYRGAILTREAVGFMNLWEWIQARPCRGVRQEVVTAVARAVHSMHQAGVDHRDLNLTNVLVTHGSHGPQVLLIDFDRARLYRRALPQWRRRRNLRRLARSVLKLDPEQGIIAPSDRALFCREYLG